MASSCLLGMAWRHGSHAWTVLVLATLLHVTTSNASTSTEEKSDNSSELLYFTHPSIQEDYQASTTFDPRGMEHLYTLTNFFLDLIQEPGLPPGILSDKMFKTPVEVLNKNRGKLLSHFMGVLLVALIGLMLAVIIPIGGLLFCCCRCAGRCGGKRNIAEKSKDPCQRAIFGFFMFGVVLVMMFGVVCAFVTNEYIEHGVEALPSSLNNSVDDLQLFIKNTKSEVDNLLKKNFRQLQKRLEESLDRSGEIVKTRLGEVSKAVAVDNLTQIVSKLELLQSDMAKAMEHTKRLQQANSQLQLGLAAVRKDLEKILEDECSSRSCQELLKEYNLTSLAVISDFYKLPNLTAVIQNVSSLLRQDIEEEVRKGKDAFDDLSKRIQSAVNRTVPDVKKQIASVGEELSVAADNITQALDVPQLQQAKELMNGAEPYMREYSKYRWYAGLAICCSVLAIVTCFVFGLVCGACARKPASLYSDNTCNKGVGANFLLLGVALVFILSFYLLVTSSVLFVIGGVTKRVACDVLENSSHPDTRQVFTLLQDHYTSYPVSGALVDIAGFLSLCHKNFTLYRALELDQHNRVQIGSRVIQLVNFTAIKDYRHTYKVDEKLEDFLHQISINPSVTILTEQGQKLLQQLKDSPVSVMNFSVYFTLAEQKLTGLNLLDYAIELNSTAALLPASQQEVGNKLRNSALQLESYQARLVNLMKMNVAQLKELAEHLERNSEFEGKNIKDAVIDQLERAKWAQDFIQTKGKDEIKKLATEFVAEFTGLMDQYASHVQQEIEDGVAKCAPVGRVYNASMLAICQEVIQPFNGFWASLGWCMLLCLPALVLAIILAALYRRVEPYTGRLVESDYTTDNFLDRDNIPLAHVKKHGHGDRGSYDNRNGYIHDYSPGFRDQLSPAALGYIPAPQVEFSGASDTRGPPAYSLFSGSRKTAGSKPSAPSGEYRSFTQAGTSYPPEYGKPPPYYYPMA